MTYKLNAGKEYRSDLQSLRGIAIIFVLAYHLDPRIMPHGYLGVDIFFVLSGYLTSQSISNLGLLSVDSIFGYWKRRIWRIVPTLLFVSIMTVLISWWYLPPIFIGELGDHTLGLSIFASNFVYWKNQGYFSDVAGMHPLLHTWSLSVEMQFYLVAPLIIIVASLFRTNKMFLFLFILILSFGLCVWAASNAPIANFYLLPTRIWQFIAGMLAYEIYTSKSKHQINSKNLKILIAFGFGIFFYLQYSEIWQLVTQILITLLTFFVLIKNINKSFIMNSQILLGIGTISYSLYLVHQPLIVLFKSSRSLTDLSAAQCIFLLLLSLFLAFLTYSLIEKRARVPLYYRSARFSFGLVLIYSSTLFTLGNITSSGSQNIEKVVAKHLVKGSDILFKNMDERKLAEHRVSHTLKDVESVILGSSRALQVDSNETKNSSLNLSVSGASLHDLLGLGTFSSDLLAPEIVYIGIDPWIFNKNLVENRWQSISHIVEVGEIMIENPKQSHSNQFQKIAEEAKAAGTGFIFNLNKGHGMSPKNYLGDLDQRTPDGRHIYGKSYLQLSRSQDPLGAMGYKMKDFEFSDATFSRLTELLKWMENRGADVKILLSPYSPKAYHSNQKYSQIVDRIENSLRAYASKQENVSILGSYNPNLLGCHEGEFYDGLHPKKQCVEKVFAN